MTDTNILKGSGGGGKSGGGAGRVAQEAPNTLRSKASAKIIDIVSEGPVIGLVNGAKSIFLNDTPLQASDDSFNFNGVVYNERLGDPVQDYIPGFSAASTERPVGVECEQATPIVRTITDSNVNQVRFTISIPALTEQNTSNGDLNGSSVNVAFDIKASGGSYVEVVNDTITGKTVSPYQKSYLVPLTGSAPWDIRMRRITADSATSAIQNTTNFVSYTELIDGKFIYPDTALYGITVDSESFGSQMPTRAYLIKGLVIRVPVNYDPLARTYTGNWGGSFKLAWSDNPVWCLLDLLTNERYGLGLDIDSIDLGAFYVAAQYCDQQVDDGFGGTEPRFTFNACLVSREDVYRTIQAMASSFRGMVYWSSGAVTVAVDRPQDPVKLVSAANVLDGAFSYAGTAYKARHSVALVSWSDPDDSYRAAVEVVEDNTLIEKYGYNPVDVTLIGCTSRGQAHRFGKWILDTEDHETETVTYRASLDHALLAPGDIVSVADPSYAGVRFGGRTAAVGSRTNKVKNGQAVGAVNGNIGSGGALPTGWARASNGGVTWTIIGSGTDSNGVGYVDVRFVGTTTQTQLNFTTSPQIAVGQEASVDQTWQSSGYCALVAGSATNITGFNLQVSERDSGGVNLASTSFPLTLTGTLSRFNRSRTLTSGSVAYATQGFQLGFSIGVAIDVTLRFGGCMLEQVASLSTALSMYIPTTSTAVTAKTMQLDAPVDLLTGESYTLSFPRPDGSLDTVPLINQAGVQDTMYWTAASDVAAVNGMWVISGSDVAARTFRVLAITEIEKNIFEIVALYNDPNKYARVESNVILDPINYSRLSRDFLTAPTNLTAVENVYYVNGLPKSRISVSWTLAVAPEVSGYEAFVKMPTGDWQSVGVTRPNGFDIDDAPPGAYEFKVNSYCVDGRKSQAITLTGFDADGQIAQPGAPTGLVAAGGIGSITLSWAKPADTDLRYIEVWTHTADVRASATLLTQVDADRYVHSPLAALVTRYYWVRAVNIAGVVGPWNATLGVAATSLQISHNDLADSIIETSNLVSDLQADIAAGVSVVSDVTDLEAKYTVKVNAGGYVAGYGLAVDANTATPTSEFIVLADKFAIILPSADNTVRAPFVVGTVAGVSRVSISSAFIQDASIDTAQIANAAITTAKIGNLQVQSAQIDDLTVGTTKITGNAVTNSVGASTTTDPGINTTWKTVVSVSITTDGGPVHIIGMLTWYCAMTNGSGAGKMRLLRGGTTVVAIYDVAYFMSNTTTAGTAGCQFNETPSAGTYTYYLQAYNQAAGNGTMSLKRASLLAMELKK